MDKYFLINNCFCHAKDMKKKYTRQALAIKNVLAARFLFIFFSMSWKKSIFAVHKHRALSAKGKTLFT